MIGGKFEKGTAWGYSYASIDVVEAGRRLTLYTMTVNQFTEKTYAVKTLIDEAKARGVHIDLVLLDRAFFTIDVITTLLKLKVYFITPAVKNDKVKAVMQNYDKKEPAKRRVELCCLKKLILNCANSAIVFISSVLEYILQPRVAVIIVSHCLFLPKIQV